MKKRVIVIHGWADSPSRAWFPWLKNELERKGFAVEAPQMPSSKTPKLSEWLETIEKMVGIPDLNTYFVGHSLGCVTIARYLAKLPSSVKIGGCIFVAGFSGSLKNPDTYEFNKLSEDWDWSSVKIHSDNFVNIYSTDDDIVPQERWNDMKKYLNSKVIIEENKGHFRQDEGVFELPVVVEEILRISKDV